MFSRALKALVLRRFYSSFTNKSQLKKVNRNVVLKYVQESGRRDVLSAVNEINSEINELKAMRETSETSFYCLIDEEIEEAKKRLDSIENEWVERLICEDDGDVNDMIVEVNAGVGGQEAMLFANELLDVYINYIYSQGWNCNILQRNLTDLGGIEKSVVEVNGSGCYKRLRHEAGVHRVQRVPKTEKGGRIHTSTVTVAVLPLREKELNVYIDKKDIQIETTTSTGAGGQHVNKTESCVRIKHIPSGIVVECQEERSQIVNKQRAMEKLQKLLSQQKARERAAEKDSIRKSQILLATRSDKIRTYNFLQDRITDHRIHEDLNNIREFMKGDAERLNNLLSLLEENYRKNLLESLINTKE